MASRPETTSLQPLKPLLFDDDDDADDLKWKSILNSLITGEKSPVDAAAAFDSWLVNQSKGRWETYSTWREAQFQKDDPDDFDPNDTPIPPLIGSSMDVIFLTFAKLLIAYPPNHDGQNRLIEFLEALRAMPRKKVQDGHGGWISKGEDIGLTELWPFETDQWGLAESFRRISEGKFDISNIIAF
jgi:hypothetical protein